MVQLDRHHVVLYGVALALLVVAGSVFHNWRIDVTEAKAKVAAQEQIISAINQSEAARQKQLETTLATLERLKATPSTPPQTIVEHIPQLVTLPQPVHIEPQGSPNAGALIVPKEDVVALNNKLVECQECTVKLGKVTADLGDESKKYDAMLKERNDWKTAAQGGSFWKRTKRIAVSAMCGGAGAAAGAASASNKSQGAAAGAIVGTIACALMER